MPRAGLLGGLGVCASSLALAALAGGPYLGFDSLNPWLVPFAVGLFVMLASIPFAANESILARHPERVESWERAMLVLGAVALPLAIASAALVFGGGSFDPGDSLADAVALLTLVETGLVVAVMAVWLVAG